MAQFRKLWDSSWSDPSAQGFYLCEQVEGAWSKLKLLSVDLRALIESPVVFKMES